MNVRRKTEKEVLRIIILEDNEADIALEEHELLHSGLQFKSKHVATKEEFLRALQAFRPDAVLSDYALPQFSGQDAYLLMKERSIVIPFILVTGALPEADVIEVIKSGIDDYILKENLQHLPTALQNALAKKKAERNIAEVARLREKFVTIMAHQLRTPLSVVKWSLEKLVEGDYELPPEAGAAIREAFEANQKLIWRIDDLLTVINIQEHRVLLKKGKVLPAVLVRRILEAWNDRFAKRHIRFTSMIRVPDTLALWGADEEKVHAACEKLLENALIYTPAGGSVAASLSLRQDAIHFEVVDTGVGIPSQDQSDIFRSFFRASNASTTAPDASGVGLAITKYYIEQHGGGVGFISEAGKGSRFWWDIPVRP